MMAERYLMKLTVCLEFETTTGTIYFINRFIVINDEKTI